MWKVTKFYNGRKTSSVENIDHDRMIDMVFGEVFPQMQHDDSWSVKVERL